MVLKDTKVYKDRKEQTRVHKVHRDLAKVVRVCKASRVLKDLELAETRIFPLVGKKR